MLTLASFLAEEGAESHHVSHGPNEMTRQVKAFVAKLEYSLWAPHGGRRETTL